jgi:hypothetical protein
MSDQIEDAVPTIHCHSLLCPQEGCPPDQCKQKLSFIPTDCELVYDTPEKAPGRMHCPSHDCPPEGCEPGECKDQQAVCREKQCGGFEVPESVKLVTQQIIAESDDYYAKGDYQRQLARQLLRDYASVYVGKEVTNFEYNPETGFITL